MHYTCRSFIGSYGQGSWSQYWENEPDDPQIVSQRGHLFALINILSPNDQKEISIIGHDLITEISQAYFSSLDFSVSQHLKKVLDEIVSNPLYSHLKINIVLAVVHQSRLYLASANSALVVFNRQNQLSLVLEGEDNQVKTTSGPLADNDKFLLATNAFLDEFPLDKLKPIVPGSNIQEVEESLLSLLYSSEKQEGLAAALIQAHVKDNSLEPEENTPQDSPTSVSKSSTPPPQLPLQNKSVFISNHDINQITRRKKINFFIALVLLIALSASAVLGYRKNQSDKTEARFQELKTELEQKLQNAQSVRNLNIDSAQELARQSKSIYDQMASLSVHPQDLEKFHVQIEDLLSTTGSAENFKPEFYYDTSIINEQPKYSSIISTKDTLYLLDPQVGRIDSLGAAQRNINTVSQTDKLVDVNTFTEINGKIYVIKEGEIFLAAKDDLESKVKMNSDIKPIDVASWNGALYILDSASNAIWKLNSNATGFGAPQAWLKDNQKITNSASAIAINGKIWVISGSGLIQPFERGSKVNYTQPEATFSSANNLVTTLETDILAFIDSGHLVYVYNKDGQSLAKYNLGDIQILDIAINESLNTLFLLAQDQKIYKIAL